MLTGLPERGVSKSSSGGGEKSQTCEVSQHHVVRHVSVSAVAYLHDCAPAPTGHDDGLFFLENDSPDSLGRGAKLSHKCTLLQVPDLDTPVAAATDNPGVVELQAGHTVVMRCQSVNGLICG